MSKDFLSEEVRLQGYACNIFSYEIKASIEIQKIIENIFIQIVKKKNIVEEILLSSNDGKILSEISDNNNYLAINDIKIFFVEKRRPYDEFLFFLSIKKCCMGVYFNLCEYKPNMLEVLICSKLGAMSLEQSSIKENSEETAKYLKSMKMNYSECVIPTMVEIDELYLKKLEREIVEKDSLLAMKRLLEWKLYK